MYLSRYRLICVYYVNNVLEVNVISSFTKSFLVFPNNFLYFISFACVYTYVCVFILFLILSATLPRAQRDKRRAHNIRVDERREL